MAKMIPKILSPDTESKAEIRTYKYLKENFDNSWTIFHSYRLRGENLQLKFIDAEIDFLLFNPKYGIVILEIKGGKLKYRDGVWLQNGRKIKDPEFQARINKYNIIKILNQRLNGNLRIKYAHMVYFPDSYSKVETLPPAYDSIVFDGNDTPNLEKEIIKVLSRIKGSKSIISGSIAKLILDKLNPGFQLGNTLLDRLEQNKKVFPIISSVQNQLLDFIGNYKKVLIQGCAGSGKTVLAIKKARELALMNKKVLLLCFNSLLGERLKEAVEDMKEFIYAGTYHSFCLELLNDSKFKDSIDFKVNSFWTEKLPGLMQQYLSENKLEYDAIIIDEAQDFRYEYWLNIIEHVNDNTICYVFYDSEQNIFETDFELPFETIPFTLKKVCRNSVSIVNYIKNFTSFDIEPFEESPIGEEVKVIKINDSSQRINKLKEIVSDLIKNKQIHPSNIVVLGAHSFSNAFNCDSIKYSNIEITEAEKNFKHHSNLNQVKYYTFMKYKGCESDVVILFDVNIKDERWYNGIYTAASRARSLLYVLLNSASSNN